MISKNKPLKKIKNKYLSMDEYYFSLYLDELKQFDFILDYEYEPNEIQFTTGKTIIVKYNDSKKIKDQNVKLHPSMSYTPDFKIVWNLEKSDGILTKSEGKTYKTKQKEIPFTLLENSNISYIEIKPEYDLHNMTRYVKVKLSCILQLFNIYIQIINYEPLFKKTFYPSEYFKTLQGKDKIKGGRLLKNSLTHRDSKEYFFSNKK
jgi:hypothetical protein